MTTLKILLFFAVQILITFGTAIISIMIDDWWQRRKKNFNQKNTKK